MNEDLFDDLGKRLNGETPSEILYESAELDFEEVVVIGRKGDETWVNYDYQSELTALGMLEVAKAEILSNLESE